mgnify:CR=1 FL=1
MFLVLRFRESNIFQTNFFTFPTMTDASNKKGSSSRLDRLLALLASGSTSSARAQAAEQIGELVLQSCKTSSSRNHTAGEVTKINVHAGMLPTVLRKVRECSRAKEWETRVAAGKAMEELQLIAERAIKTVHLLYLFCVVISPCHLSNSNRAGSYANAVFLTVV